MKKKEFLRVGEILNSKLKNNNIIIFLSFPRKPKAPPMMAKVKSMMKGLTRFGRR